MLSDLILAGVICLAACAYWLWDGKASAGAPSTQPPVAAVEPEQQAARSVTNAFNDEGFRLYTASHYAAAEVQFRSAIGANPKGAVGFCNLGAALIAQRKFDEAIGVLGAAIALDPSLTLAHNNLSWALQAKAQSSAGFPKR